MTTWMRQKWIRSVGVFPDRFAITFLVLAMAVPRLWLAFADQGLFWPDEFYQTIEQAHRFAFGPGIVPWEFVEGARSWVYPGAIGLLWKLAGAVGVSSGLSLVILAKLTAAAMSTGTIVFAMKIAGRTLEIEGKKSVWGQLFAGLFVGLFPANLLFASKNMTETVSGFLLTLATYLVLPVPPEVHGTAPDKAESRVSERSFWRFGLAGSIAALSIFVRYQNGVCAGLLFLIPLAQRRVRAALGVAAGGIPVALAGGLLDYFTWGRPFHSFLKYVSFHSEGKAAMWGVERYDYYLRYSWLSAGPVVLLAAFGVLLLPKRHWWFVAIPLSIVMIHSFVPHKEYRFIVQALPVLFAFSAAGLALGIDRLAKRLKANRKLVGLILCAGIAAGFTERAIYMTFADLGHRDGLAAGLASRGDSPWHAAEGIQRLLSAAGTKPDACGVSVRDIPWSSTGGYAYLHRDIPLYFDGEAPTLERANYLIARREYHQPSTYFAGEESYGFTLFHREGGCTAPPSDYTRKVPP